MSKKANPTTVGLFVLVALVLAIGGVLLFSSSKWFGKRHPYICYFDGSVKGLNPGSKVMVKGVQVGTVSKVLLHFNQAEGDLNIPVLIELSDSLIRPKSDSVLDLEDQAEFDRLVERGLRARLQAESFVTGMLYVDLDILSNAPPPVFHQDQPLFREIPTVPNEIQVFMQNLAKMDFGTLMEKLDAVLATLNSQLGDLQMAKINEGLTNVLSSLDDLISSADLTNSLASLDKTLNEIRMLSETARAEVGPLSSEARETLEEARHTLAQLSQTGENLQGLLDPHAPFTQELTRALEELGSAARAIADLADYLNRNPNALLSGRKPRE